MMQAIIITCEEVYEDEPQPQPPAPETTTPEATLAREEGVTPPTALAPLEEEVIEGEVTAIIEPTPKPTPKHPPYYVIVVVTIVGCCLFTLASLLLPLLTPTATVTIIPVERSLSITTAIQVQGRSLLPLTLSQSISVSATGKRHQDATQLLTSQAETTLGATYRPFGDVQVSIIQARMIHPRQGVAGLVVQATGTWVYQITLPMQNHLLLLVAGMKTQQARATLLTFPGIAGVQITVKGGDQRLPQDPKAIRLIVLHRSM